MELLAIRPTAVCQSIVMLFQFLGILGLLLSRLMPASIWARRGKLIFLLGLIGLGFAGVLSGSQPTGSSLMAGGTITALLVGMNLGTHVTDSPVAIGTTRPALPRRSSL